MKNLEPGPYLHFRLADVISPLMHPDQFFRMSCLWREEHGCHGRAECVGVSGGGGGRGLAAVRVYPISDWKANGLGDQG